MLRHDWTIPEISALYTQPFPDLIYQAHRVHRAHFDPAEIQRSTLLSIKTGGCAEDCAYCPQSVHHNAGVQEHPVLPVEYVLEKARQAKAEGSTRFCMGAAWREIPEGPAFEAVLELVGAVRQLGLEVCCTLGMLTDAQARRLKAAGCTTYNHNLDTSPEFYGRIISTRTYKDRLDTLQRVRAAGMTICCGGIIGMGESLDDRFSLLAQLANQDPHPESVPINALQPVEGTPLAQGVQLLDPIEFVRTIATARIVMPSSYVRLSAGRANMSDEAQALCFLAGANSIFAGEKLLTQPNAPQSRDHALMSKLGMRFREIPAHFSAPPAEGFHAHACDHERR